MANQVVPSQMTKLIYKQKVKAAEKGWDLLKKKNDSLKKKMQEIMITLIEKKKMVKSLFLKAYMAMAESEWSAGDFYQQIINQVDKASFSLDIKFDNIAGVQLPTFIAREEEGVTLEKISRTQGGAQIQKARNYFKELLEVVVDIASLQSSFVKLDMVIKITSRRVNALEYIVIPKFKGIIIYINQELEEQAREQKFVMKKVLDNRKKIAELKEKEDRERKDKGTEETEETEDIFNIEDEGILF